MVMGKNSKNINCNINVNSNSTIKVSCFFDGDLSLDDAFASLIIEIQKNKEPSQALEKKVSVYDVNK